MLRRVIMGAIKRGKGQKPKTKRVCLIYDSMRFHQNCGTEAEANGKISGFKAAHRRTRVAFRIESFRVLFKKEHPEGEIGSSDWSKGKGFSIWYCPTNLEI